MNLRIASFNIRLGLEKGLDAVISSIAHMDPDLIAIQEVGRHWRMGTPVDEMQVVSSRVGLPYWAFAATIIDGSHIFGHGLLSRYPITSADIHFLPQTRDEPRALLKTTIPIGIRRHLTIISTHLSHLDDERPKQIDLLVELASQLPSPSLVLGDLNEPSPDELVQRLAIRDVHDAAAIPAPTYPAVAPTDRRDLILAKGLRTVEPVRVANDLSSDHRPIVCRLALD